VVNVEKFLAIQAYPETPVSCRGREFRASLGIPGLSPKASVSGRSLRTREESESVISESVLFVGAVKEGTETSISW
jgi:hypothetical protein